MSGPELLARIFGAALAFWLVWELKKAFSKKEEPDQKRDGKTDT